MSAADFWSNQERAQGIVEQLKAVKAVFDPWEAFASGLEDAGVLLELAEEEGDEASLLEVDEQAAALTAELGGLEFRAMLSGPLDAKGAFVQI